MFVSLVSHEQRLKKCWSMISADPSATERLFCPHPVNVFSPRVQHGAIQAQLAKLPEVQQRQMPPDRGGPAAGWRPLGPPYRQLGWTEPQQSKELVQTQAAGCGKFYICPFFLDLTFDHDSLKLAAAKANSCPASIGYSSCLLLSRLLSCCLNAVSRG